MRKVLTAAFCVSLLILMLLSTSVSVQPNLEEIVEKDGSEKTASVNSLAWELAQKAGGSSGDDRSNAIATDSNGDIYVTGSFEQTAAFGSITLTSAGNDDIFVAKMNSSGGWLWAIQAGGPNDDHGVDLDLDNSGNVYLTGKFQNTALFGLDSMTAGPTSNDDFFVAKIDTWGNWQWVEGADCHNNGRCYGTSIAVDSNGYAYVTGSFTRDVNFGSTTLTWAGVEDVFVTKIDTWGNWQWATMGGGAQGYDVPNSIAIGPYGNAYLTGYHQFTSTFGNTSITANGGSDLFMAKISQQGDWIWTEGVGGTQTSVGNSIVVDSQGRIYICGSFYTDISFGNFSYTTGGTSNAFIAKATEQGGTIVWNWATKVSSTNSNSAEGLALDSNGDLVVTGGFRGTASFGNTAMTSIGNQDVFVTKIHADGNWSWAKMAGGGNVDAGLGVDTDAQGNLYVSGYFVQNTISFGTINIPASGGFDAFVAKMSSDYDQDNLPDSLDTDDDGDFILDNLDGCNPSPFGFQSLPSTDHDGDGCRDSDEDLDDDGDGVVDENDACPRGWTDWTPDNVTDIDMDGCYDAAEDLDDDNDGFEDFSDECPVLFGNSTYPFEKGCPDRDGDTRPDVNDPFPDNPLEWEDSDRDGVGNNSDAFPYDATQTQNQDGDQYGDNPFGNLPDACPNEYGTSLLDVYGCVDSDGDGVSDINDQFPNDPEVWQDSDGDGVEDGLDDFPYNPTQSIDSDGDGFGNNPMGSIADRFVDDKTQWSDVDGDGYGDNQSGNMPDAFPLDPTQWMDSDGDGYGDNPSGSMPDAFPLDPTQWIDEDNDGLGDNPEGNNADPYLFDSDNDGYDNSIDPLPFLSTPGDRDNDGVPDENDWAPGDPYEWADFDGDGIGDNEDIDDDNDNWDDWTEMREGTDAKDNTSYPIEIERFEIPITDDIALSAWDLLALISGLPLAGWLIFGFTTRNARTDAFEGRMREAKTREELEEVATEYERSLMIRLIGPHQGIRLERVRAELDDEIEMSEAKLTGDDDDLDPVVTTPDQTDYTEVELGLEPPEDAEIIDDGKGYEWIEQGEDKWYREVKATSWIKWET
ncbi:MAG: SBBP repeat-containing protein [Candidatus Thalassarchaeaceae archaeon]|nr:SBBP repeat-containing protein [Candidatus Thalassarchaeaceae archaeon]